MQVSDFILARIGELYCELAHEQRKGQELKQQLDTANAELDKLKAPAPEAPPDKAS